MTKTLASLGIDTSLPREKTLEALDIKKEEILDRLNHVDNEERRAQLEKDLTKCNILINDLKDMNSDLSSGEDTEGLLLKEDSTEGLLAKQPQGDAQPDEETAALLKAMEAVYKEADETLKVLDSRAQAIKEIEMQAMQFPHLSQMTEGLSKFAANDPDNGWNIINRIPMNERIDLLEFLVQQGDAEACFCLGKHYAEGSGVIMNPQKAAECYQQAANRGSANGAYEMGEAYRNGNGVPANQPKKIDFYLTAAKKGHSTATDKLADCIWKQSGGDCTFKESGIYSDNQRLYDWLIEKAENSAHWSRYVSRVHREGKIGGLFGRNDAKAMKYAERAFEIGNDWYKVAAKNEMGLIYNNMGNNSKALECFTYASDHGNSYASGNIAFYARQGKYGFGMKLKASYYEKLSAEQRAKENQ